MRKTLKVLHTIAACGLIGGLGCYMILLAFAPQETPAGYADLRQSIAAISSYIVLPSLAIAVISGLLAMMVHRPFLNKGWVWLKAAAGILMFKGVLTIVGSKADHAAAVSRQIAEGEPLAEVLEQAIAYEWHILYVIMAISVANVVVGIWRPRRSSGKRQRPTLVAETAPASETEELTRPAA